MPDAWNNLISPAPSGKQSIYRIVRSLALCSSTDAPGKVCVKPRSIKSTLTPQSLHALERYFDVPDFIQDPSPEAFMLACLTYAFATIAIYRLHPNDQYRQRFLLSAMCFAALLSSIKFHNIRNWLPSTITAASVLSLFTHYIFPNLRADAVEVEERGINGDKPLCLET